MIYRTSSPEAHLESAKVFRSSNGAGARRRRPCRAFALRFPPLRLTVVLVPVPPARHGSTLPPARRTTLGCSRGGKGLPALRPDDGSNRHSERSPEVVVVAAQTPPPRRETQRASEHRARTSASLRPSLFPACRQVLPVPSGGETREEFGSGTE